MTSDHQGTSQQNVVAPFFHQENRKPRYQGDEKVDR
jgi:hypothetical protein